jgi:hypothetical protein
MCVLEVPCRQGGEGATDNTGVQQQKYRWKADKCGTFQQKLGDETTNALLGEFYVQITNCNVNSAVQCLCEILYHAASDMKCIVSRSVKQSQPGWWDM